MDILIELLRHDFTPVNGLYQDYSRFKDMKQGIKSVKDYAEAFQEAISRIDTGMSESMKTMTFINGLTKKIRKKTLLMTNKTLIEAINNAKLVESSIKMEDDKSVSIIEPTEKHIENINSQINAITDRLSNLPLDPNKNKYSRDNPNNQSQKPPLKCYYCGRIGHITRDCRAKATDEGRQRIHYQRTPSQERERPPYRGLSPGRNAYPERNQY